MTNDVHRGRAVLERAALRIARPGCYTTAGLAVDAKGKRVTSTSRQAAAWSMVGAIHLELSRLRYSPTQETRLFRKLKIALAAVIREQGATVPSEPDSVTIRSLDASASLHEALAVLDGTAALLARAGEGAGWHHSTRDSHRVGLDTGGTSVG